MVLIPGYYRCQNCGRDVARVRRIRRFRICDDCWEAIVTPTHPDVRLRGVAGEDEIFAARDRFWGWISEMERRYPRPLSRSNGRRLHPQREADDYYPLCECGRPRQPFSLGGQPGLWGGPFQQYCPVCAAKGLVEAAFRLASGGVHPDWDEEDWLDLLYQSHREAFDLGILPDYWFELMRRENHAV